MSQLIRFEDKYGMTDIVCLVQELGIPNASYEKLTCKTLKNSIIIQYGLAIGSVLRLDDLLKSEIKKYNVEEIIYVFDMDAISGKGILTVDELQENIDNIDKALKGLDKPIRIRYAPVVWAAETIALYILLETYVIGKDLKREECMDITSFVHSKNTVV